jgi:hypothetical protein
MGPDELRPLLEARHAGWAAAETSSRPGKESELLDDGDAACSIATVRRGGDSGEESFFPIACRQRRIDAHIWAGPAATQRSSDVRRKQWRTQ